MLSFGINKKISASGKQQDGSVQEEEGAREVFDGLVVQLPDYWITDHEGEGNQNGLNGEHLAHVFRVAIL